MGGGAGVSGGPRRRSGFVAALALSVVSLGLIRLGVLSLAWRRSDGGGPSLSAMTASAFATSPAVRGLRFDAEAPRARFSLRFD